MLLAWKNAQRFEASTFLLIDSVWAPLPSVSDSARQSAITAISSAIFLFSPAASLVCSACSMLSCALMIPSAVDWYPRLTEQRRLRKWQGDVTETCQDGKPSDLRRGDAPFCRLPAAVRYRCRYKSVWSRAKRGRAAPGSRADRRHG